MASGLLRFSSAPSSLIGEACEEFLPMESFLARFLASNSPDEISEKSGHGGGGGRQMNRIFKTPREKRSQLSSVSNQMLFHSERSMAENPYGAVSSMSIEAEQMKFDHAGANLIRQSSSPVGFVSHLNADSSGHSLVKGMEGSILNDMGQISFSSRNNSLSQISEMVREGASGGGRSPEKSGSYHCFMPGYTETSWEDSFVSKNFSDRVDKKAVDHVGQTQTQFQKSADFSLPKTTSEIAAIEKFLQYQDSVPCKIRAKRGCATHPRSVAERVRRTRISERIRKLQELVPNMDKQTNTADRLDLAVDFIKDLQGQLKLLSDSKAACICSANKSKLHQIT